MIRVLHVYKCFGPKKFGGVEAYSIDQSTTALGRGVQVKHLPSAANLRPGSAPAATAEWH